MRHREGSSVHETINVAVNPSYYEIVSEQNTPESQCSWPKHSAARATESASYCALEPCLQCERVPIPNSIMIQLSLLTCFNRSHVVG